MTGWRKASSCNGATACVEVALLPDGGVAVRDSKNPDRPVLVVPVGAWWSFLAAAKTGQVGSYGGLVQLRRVALDSWAMWLTSGDGVRLQFDEGEIAAFLDGIHRHEFDLASLGAGAEGLSVAPGSTLAAL